LIEINVSGAVLNGPEEEITMPRSGAENRRKTHTPGSRTLKSVSVIIFFDGESGLPEERAD